MIKRKRIVENNSYTLVEVEKRINHFLKFVVEYMLQPNPVVDTEDGRFDFTISMNGVNRSIFNTLLDCAEAYTDEGNDLTDWNVVSESVGDSYTQFIVNDDSVEIEYKDNAIAMVIEVGKQFIEVNGEVFEMTNEPRLVPLSTIIDFDMTDIKKIK